MSPRHPVDAAASEQVIDQVAAGYVELSLRCDVLFPGILDAYTGDPAFARAVRTDPCPPASALARRAAELRASLPGQRSPRGDFLDAQLRAVEVLAGGWAGRRTDYRAELRSCFDIEVPEPAPGPGWDPALGPDGGRRIETYRAAHAALAALLPGGGPLAARMAAYRKVDEMPAGRLEPALRALSGALREVTRREIGLPDDESVSYEVVRDRPWSALNHHAGGPRSRIAVDAATGSRASRLPQLVAHEAYPGHHTERCRRPSGRGVAHPERTVMLLNTPQCLLSEGMAELGLSAAVGPEWGAWSARVLAGVGVRLDGELAQQVERATAALLPVRQDAALLLHAGHADPDTVVAYLRRWLLVPEARARRMLEFLRHPLWRTYATTYVEGRALLEPWLALRPAGQTALARLRRLMDEPLTPGAVRAEIRTAASPGPSADAPAAAPGTGPAVGHVSGM